jgi:Uma2 family endonuclease
MRLAIEVADSTRNMDLGTKAALYARAGVPEYWVVSVEERIVYVHTAPQPDGSYARVEKREPEILAPSFAPDATVSVAALLPPA